MMYQTMINVYISVNDLIPEFNRRLLHQTALVSGHFFWLALCLFISCWFFVVYPHFNVIYIYVNSNTDFHVPCSLSPSIRFHQQQVFILHPAKPEPNIQIYTKNICYNSRNLNIRGRWLKSMFVRISFDGTFGSHEAHISRLSGD